ncbi:MAG TPA: hypothetical protein VEP66_08725 [Myxococcales bacterium]|nr:hypothetical protein [Myxococcales bacterium]
MRDPQEPTRVAAVAVVDRPTPVEEVAVVAAAPRTLEAVRAVRAVTVAVPTADRAASPARSQAPGPSSRTTT